MSPFTLPRAIIRTLFVTAICILLLGVTVVWSSGQQAGGSSSVSTRRSAAGLLAFDKQDLRPALTVITVNSLSDVSSGSDGLCTLREAISAANNNASSGGLAGECGAGSSFESDTINFSVTGTINLTSALPDIFSNMTITGPGSSQLTVRRNTGGIIESLTSPTAPRAFPA